MGRKSVNLESGWVELSIITAYIINNKLSNIWTLLLSLLHGLTNNTMNPGDIIQ